MELNAEQIKKALECCANAYDCFTCDIYKRQCIGGFRTNIAQNALALINSQEQRIKELTEENEAWQKRLISTEEQAGKAYYDLACEVENLRAENERLHASCTELTQECKKWQGRIKIECEYTKADTVRKMQERLKEYYHFKYKGKEYVAITDNEIDQIAKEMLEGE